MNDGHANLEMRDELDYTPLLSASRKGNLKAVIEILGQGARLRAVDHRGWNALHHAAYGGHADVVRALSVYDADNYASGPRVQPMALSRNRAGRRPADIAKDTRTRQYLSNLFVSAFMGDIDECRQHIKRCVRRGAGPSLDAPRKSTPGKGLGMLHMVVIGLGVALRKTSGNASRKISLPSSAVESREFTVKRYCRMFDMLHKAGCDVSARDKRGVTPLMLAARIGAPYACSKLIKMGAAVDDVDNAGNAPLHYAYAWRRSRVANTLSDAGADEMVRNNNGHTPTDVAGTKSSGLAPPTSPSDEAKASEHASGEEKSDEDRSEAADASRDGDAPADDGSSKSGVSNEEGSAASEKALPTDADEEYGDDFED